MDFRFSRNSRNMRCRYIWDDLYILMNVTMLILLILHCVYNRNTGWSLNLILLVQTLNFITELRHDKTNKVSVCPAKTQISLGICPVWSESSLWAQWVAKDPRFLYADSEDSDQTGRMPRLIWVFAGRTVTLLVLSCRGSTVLILILNIVLIAFLCAFYFIILWWLTYSQRIKIHNA